MPAIRSFPGIQVSLAVVALAGVAFVTPIGAQSPAGKVESDPFPLDICIVMKGPLSRKANVVEVAEREIRVCCLECVDDVRKDPEKFLLAVDDKIKEEQREIYPLETCVVDGGKLEAGVILDVVFRNRLFRLCGEDCQKKLEKEPARYFAALNLAVIAKQKTSYPLKQCVVSGKPLDDKAVDHVVGNQLVRLADASQVVVFNQSAGEYLSKVREAPRKPASK